MNFSGAEEPELTSIINELNRTVDQEKRAELSEAAADYVHDHMINSFILHPSTIVAYDGDRVKNWPFSNQPELTVQER